MSIFFRSQYTPLPSPGSPSSTARRRPRWILTLALVVLAALLIWLARQTLFKPAPYSPLIDYQHLNSSPLLSTSSNSSKPLDPSRLAVVSTLYSDSYAIGAAVLLHSIKSQNISANHFYLAYLSGRISTEALCIVRAAGWEPIAVPFIPPPHGGKGVYYRFFDQYTKLNIWSLGAGTIDKAVYLDADTLVLRNFDELFSLPWSFGAVPDVYLDNRGFTVGFNAGVMVYTPDEGILKRMKDVLEVARYPLQQAEQAFLNVFWGPAMLRLPYAYNANLAIKKVSKDVWRSLVERPTTMTLTSTSTSTSTTTSPEGTLDLMMEDDNEAKPELRIVHYTLVKPFVDERDRSGKMLRDDERLRQIMDEAGRKENGLFKDEVGWWRSVYEDMMSPEGEVGRGIAVCRREALTNFA